MTENLSSTCFLGSASGPALQARAQAVGALAGKACHGQDVFSPLLFLRKRKLTERRVSVSKKKTLNPKTLNPKTLNPGVFKFFLLQGDSATSQTPVETLGGSGGLSN